jgi:hypothetical protein
VAAELAGGDFSQAFEAQRRILPESELTELADLHVTVVPRSVEITASSRTFAQHDVQIDIGVQKKISKATDTDVAALLGLIEEIAEFLKRRALAAIPYAVWVKTANDPIYSPDHLAEQRLFTSVLTLTYRVLK